jgi:hypothetical protein
VARHLAHDIAIVLSVEVQQIRYAVGDQRWRLIEVKVSSELQL